MKYKVQSVCLGLLWVFALCLPVASQANGFPNQASFAGHNLLLNGVGKRSKFVFDLYSAGLYLPAKSSNAEAILAANEPQALRLHITSGQITSQNMEEAVIEGFKRSAGGRYAALQARIEQLIAVFRQPIKLDDVYDFVYSANHLVIIKNGQQAARIAGADFKQAFLGIWLGRSPVQASLKQALLGY